jgi:hypothetical protein
VIPISGGRKKLKKAPRQKKEGFYVPFTRRLNPLLNGLKPLLPIGRQQREERTSK